MKNSNILIVDDDLDNIFLLEVILKNHSFVTVPATNGLEAVEAVKNNDIDLILMDIMMPKMDGFEASRSIRNMERSAHIPIILITAKRRESGDVIRGLEEGALEYLTKPFDENELIARVKSMLRLKHLHDDNMKLLKKVKKQQDQMQMDLRVAEIVQRDMLPSEEHLSNFKNCGIAAHYKAATNIGGDMYDVFEYGKDRTAFVLADVAGHGPAAALIMALLKALIQSESLDYPTPRELALRLNAKLTKMTPETHFVTCFFGIADFSKNELTYVTAGHPPPYLVGKRDNAPGVLKSTGSLIGIFDNGNAFFEEETVNFQKGDKLVLFSDGVYEASNSEGNQYGIERLAKLVKAERQKTAQEMTDEIVADVESFWNQNDEQDDIAIVTVEFL